ncbi:MAG: DNA-3-methyladenine glycosylase family protein [Lachnospirales bacterium]
MFFKYTEEQLNILKQKNDRVSLIIDEIGLIERPINTNHFATLVNQIIGQQISKQASKSIRNKFLETVKEVTPKNIMEINDETLKSCGLSQRKVEYIKNLSFFALENENFFKKINYLSDEEIFNSLIEVKGIGEWTIEMFMIFSLNRLNILSYNDLIIKKSLMRIHNLEKMDKKIFLNLKEIYSPYCSILSLYLWELNSRKDIVF